MERDGDFRFQEITIRKSGGLVARCLLKIRVRDSVCHSGLGSSKSSTIKWLVDMTRFPECSKIVEILIFIIIIFLDYLAEIPFECKEYVPRSMLAGIIVGAVVGYVFGVGSSNNT